MGSNQKDCLNHIHDNHLDYRFPCNFCDRVFKVYNTKYRHKQEHKEEPLHICADCGMAFLYESELNRHVGVHIDVLPYPCEKCTKRFASKKSKDRHLQSHEAQSITCKACGKVSTSCESTTHISGELTARAMMLSVVKTFSGWHEGQGIKTNVPPARKLLHEKVPRKGCFVHPHKKTLWIIQYQRRKLKNSPVRAEVV